MRRALATLAIAAAALPVAACGRDQGKPIPRSQSNTLIAVLGTAQRQADAGSCGTLLRDTVPSLKRRADALDSSVGSDVRKTIQDGVDRLRQLAEDECAQRQQQTTTQQSTSTSDQSTTDSTASTDTTGTTDTGTTGTDTNTTGTDTTGTTGTDTTGTTGTGTTGTGTGTTGTDTGGNGGTPPGTPKNEVPAP